MNIDTIPAPFANTKISTSALVDLDRPEQAPVCRTPVLTGGGEMYLIVLADARPILLAAADIEALGGTVPETGDILVAAERKFQIAGKHWHLVSVGNGWQFTPC